MLSQRTEDADNHASEGNFIEAGLEAPCIPKGEGLEFRVSRRFKEGDPYSTSPHQSWSEGTRQVSRELPGLVW